MAETKTARRRPSIPTPLRADLTQYAKSIRRKYKSEFEADRELKNRALRLLKALLPPRRRRGRPRNPELTRVIVLRQRLRRKFPDESPRQIWDRTCPRVIAGYDRMTEIEQRTAREDLRQRITWRRRK